jgi:hypothetical protein
MQAATSHVQRGEATEVAAMAEREGEIKNPDGEELERMGIEKGRR